MPKFLHDTATVLAREISPELRSPVTIVLAMAQPLLFLLLFGSMLAGAGADVGPADTWQWFVPGILVMMCLLGPLAAGHRMLAELNGGQMERFLVTPVSRTAMIVGRTAKDTITLTAQAVVLITVAIPLGMRLHLPGAVATAALLVVMAVGLSAFSYVLAIASLPSGNLFWIVTQMLIFPITLLSGILLPVDAGPGWLQAVASVNPVAYIVDGTRALFVGDFLVAPVLHAVIAVAALAAVGLLLSTRAMKQGA